MRRNQTAILATTGSILLIAAYLYLYYDMPADIGPEQPIPFSHNVHSGVKEIQCQYCHPYVAYSNFPGMPPVAKCLHCHTYIIAQHPWIQKEHQYFNTDTPTPWVKVNVIAEHVFFNHQRHINSKFVAQRDLEAARKIGYGIIEHVRILEDFPLIGPVWQQAGDLAIRQIGNGKLDEPFLVNPLLFRSDKKQVGRKGDRRGRACPFRNSA